MVGLQVASIVTMLCPRSRRVMLTLSALVGTICQILTCQGVLERELSLTSTTEILFTLRGMRAILTTPSLSMALSNQPAQLTDQLVAAQFATPLCISGCCLPHVVCCMGASVGPPYTLFDMFSTVALCIASAFYMISAGNP